MASADNISLARMGTRRTGLGVAASGQHAPETLEVSAGRSDNALDALDALDGDALELVPVSRRQQASVLVASFLAIALSIGYNQCYGVFLEYYQSADQDMLTRPEQQATALLAFVGTLGAGLTWGGSIVVNPWLSRVEHAANKNSKLGTPRCITLAGVALMALGFVLASFARRVWQLLLTQGLLYGAGSSMLYFPLLGPAPEYFSRHRATALGVILSGGGVGSVVLTPAVRALLSAVGGRWTLRALAALVLVVGLPVAWAVPPSRFPASTHSSGGVVARRTTHVSRALWATPVFLLAVATALCQAAGGSLPVTFIPSYSVALGLSAGAGATLLSVANGVNAAARVATGYAGDRYGRLNVLAVSLAAAAAAVGALWGTSASAPDTESSVRLWIAFVVLYAVSAGGYYALFPATMADVFGIRHYAAVNGFIYFVRGCGTMLGSPVGGVLLGAAPSSAGYAGVIAWDGALLAGSAVCVLGVRWADALRRGWAWRA